MAEIDIRRATEENFAQIHRAALVLTGNPWDADDLAQETFLVMARQADRFEGRSRLSTWLYGIMLNLNRRELRRRGRQQARLQVLRERGEQASRCDPPPGAALEMKEWKKSLWSFVHQLPDRQRQVLVLRFSEHLSYDEIAQAVGCPLGTVKSRIHHGLAAVRRKIDADRADVAPPVREAAARSV